MGRIKNILAGAATVLEILPPRRRRRVIAKGTSQSDAEALLSDWEIVGDHLRGAAMLCKRCGSSGIDDVLSGQSTAADHALRRPF